MENSIKLALHILSGKILHVEEAANGLACKCVCIACGEKMQAVQGTREWHFRHDSNSACKGAQESALHKFGKQILMEARALEIPNFGRFEYDNTLVEQTLNGSQFRSDVCLKSEAKTVHVEILVRHRSERGKEQYYTNQKIESFEIDLWGFFENFSKVKLEEIRHAILESTDKKRVIYWENMVMIELSPQPPKVLESKSEGEESGSFWGWLVALIGVAFLMNFLQPWKRVTQRKRKWR